MRSRSNHGERLAALEQKLESESVAIRQHIDAKHELLMERITPYGELQRTVAGHTTQIHRWNGALGLLAFLFTSALAYLGIHRQ